MTSFLRRFPVLLGLALSPVLGPATPASAQVASLVEDINRGSGFGSSLIPGQLWALPDKVLFAGSELSSGRELWVTDGTASGTRLLSDLVPGGDDSKPRVLGKVRSVAIGIITPPGVCCGPSSRTYLWRSDGTPEGTYLLPDPTFRVVVPIGVNPGEPEEDASVPFALAADGAYFNGCIARLACSLWHTDGTPEGTREVRSFGGDGFSGGPTQLTLAGGWLYFVAAGQLWASDGTEAGTISLRTFAYPYARLLAPLGGKVLFLAPAVAPGTGEELWVSDGTVAGTRALTAFEVLSPFGQTNFLKPLGDRIYFVADDVTHGAELWTSDGTSAGTARVTDFPFHDPFRGPDNERGDGIFSSAVEKVGARLVFWANDGLAGFRPWVNLETSASTSPLCAGCRFEEETIRFVQLNGRVLFRGNDGTHGTELWASDGTAAGTRLVKDVCAGSCSGAESELVKLPAGVFFQGRGAAGDRDALWTSDGTPQGTRRFAAVEPISLDRPVAAAALGDKVLFGGLGASSDPFSRQSELWLSDGTSAGTRQLSASGQGDASAEIAQLTASGDRAYFTASESGDLHHVWRSTGTEEGALKSPEPSFFDFGESSRLAAAGGKVFLILASYPKGNQVLLVAEDGSTVPLTHFDDNLHVFDALPFQRRLYFVVARDLSFGASELWQSDGTPEGTHRAVDLPGLVGAHFLRVVGQEIWFLAHDSSIGSEVWRTDGTQAGTHRVTDSSFSRTRRDPEFTQVGATVYFVALRSGGDDFDSQVWRSDGTPQGTALVSDFPALNATRAFPAELTAFQGSLYFFASLPTTGRALWRSDGTAEGTIQLREYPLAAPSFSGDSPPRFGLTTLGGRLIFAIDDGGHGREPWVSDGTAAGTLLLRDVRPGAGSSEVTGFTAAAGRLYFAANDGAHGMELWRTDGTAPGTRLVQDLAPEAASSSPEGLIATSSRLFFSADDGLSGREVWALPLSGPTCQPSSTALCLNGGRFQVAASWRVPGDELGSHVSGQGNAVPLSADTGYFWFFDPANVEAVLKVLDGIGINGHHWVFYGALSDVEYTLTVTDTQSGLARRYANVPGQLSSVGDTQAFGPQGARARLAPAGGPSMPLAVAHLDPAAATGTCVPASTRLCLNGGRFAVEAVWKDFAGQTGAGTAVGLTGDTGTFWFFDAANVEVVLKVLDGNAVNGHFWVFYGALSNVEYTLTVTDTLTGTVKSYRNPSGRFASVADTSAF